MHQGDFEQWMTLFRTTAEFGGFLLMIYTATKVSKQATVITDLEKNTNSIKDALVKVTGEAEHAKGVMVGRSEILEKEK